MVYLIIIIYMVGYLINVYTLLFKYDKIDLQNHKVTWCLYMFYQAGLPTFLLSICHDINLYSNIELLSVNVCL